MRGIIGVTICTISRLCYFSEERKGLIRVPGTDLD
jgi:hypothetical protein